MKGSKQLFSYPELVVAAKTGNLQYVWSGQTMSVGSGNDA